MSYNVFYSGNGYTAGTVPTDATAYANEAEVIAKVAGTMARTGYTFAGWNTKRDGSGTSIAAGEDFHMGISDITLYAQWAIVGGDGSSGSLLDDTLNICTLDELKTYLNIRITDVTKDSQLEEVVNAVSKNFEHISNRYFKQRLQVSEYYDGDGTDTLLLDNPPVANLKIYINSSTPRSYTVQTNVNYIICTGKDAEIGKVFFDGDVFEKGVKTVKAIYDAGYATIPYNIKRAALIVCANIWSREADKLKHAQSITVQGSSITISEKDIPSDIFEMLLRYRKGMF